MSGRARIASSAVGTPQDLRRAIRSAARRLRRHCPVGPVRVHLRAPADEGICGEAAEAFEGRPARILVHPGKGETLAMEILAHEWAHLLAYQAGVGDREPHGAAWGRFYSVTYRVVFEGSRSRGT